jgi:release factor glutamine methyltransferase
MAQLPPEVRQEPEIALCGGEDGLEFYRRLTERGLIHLKPTGFMAVEVGAGQAAAVSRLAGRSGWRTEQIVADYAGIERVVVLRPAAPEAVGG